MFDSPLVRKLVDLALEEDVAHGDITAQITVPENHTSQAKVIAREKLVVCGLDIVGEIVKAGSWGLAVHKRAAEGAWACDGEILVELSGSTRELLSAERTILNFLQRLSGVATYTREFCEGQNGLKILDTRKTMPGWRLLDKYAVKTGGASNHRFSLGDMVLVKNNHIEAHPQGIKGALADVVAKKPLGMSWEVEVRDLEELKVALSFNPTIVMLDNFNDDTLTDAVALVRAVPHQPMIEVSGGVSKERLVKIQAAGIDAASVGALTTRAPNVDISMRII
jgi:nicotinate-nucleotide pyrophosphorylase (carboxylating)